MLCTDEGTSQFCMYDTARVYIFFRLAFDLSSICSYLLGFFQRHCDIAWVEGTSAGWVEAGVPKWPQGRWGSLPTGGGAGAASCKRLRDCWEGIPDEGSTEAEAVRPKRAWHFQRLKGHLFCWSLRTKGWENGSWWSWNGRLWRILCVFYSFIYLASIYWTTTMYQAQF